MLGGFIMAIQYLLIDDILIKMAINEPSIEDFTVNNILYAVGLDQRFYLEVFRYLMTKRDYCLIPKKILLCPNNHKGETFLLSEPIDDEEQFFCWVCGENYYYNPDSTIIAFSFTQEFKEQAKKKQRRLKVACI